MTDKTTKPNIVISKCIEFDFCRYNSQIIRNEFVNSLKPHVKFKTICPEVEIGLGIPRDPIRIILDNDRKKLVQPSTKLDVTSKMMKFSIDFLSTLNQIDGFILKSRSPSCGIKEVKIYPTIEKSAPIDKGKGFFGEAALNSYPFAAIEDETRLNNSIIREHFLKRIFTFSRFRNIKTNPSINKLIKFQTENKFLLMSYNQAQLKNLGKIVASHKKKSLRDIYKKYEDCLFQALSRAPRCTSNINVLQHAFGYFSKNINQNEKKLFSDSINDFREGRVSINVPITIIRSWITRFDNQYLNKQTFFNPYPKELINVESIAECSARNYWK